MKKAAQLMLVAFAMFATAAGASLTWQKMNSAEHGSAKPGRHARLAAEDADETADETASEPPEPPATRDVRAATIEALPARTTAFSTTAPSVEETVRLASSLRERAAQVREREDQLVARQRQFELVIEDIRSERATIEELREELEAAIQAGEDRLAELQRQKTELDIQQQTIDGRVTEMTGLEKDNIKKMASVYDAMAAESAAKIIQHMADSGTMDTAVKLLAVMKERQAAKVLAEMADPSLAAQLSERLKDFKHPKSSKQQ